MMIKFCQASNLKALLSEPDVDDAMKTLSTLTSGAFDAQQKGSLMSDIRAQELDSWRLHTWTSKERSSLTEEERSLLSGGQDSLCSIHSVQRAGQTFQAVEPNDLADWKAGRNSTIYFKAGNAQIKSGRIRRIISDASLISEDSVRILVQPHSELPECEHAKDPWRDFPELNAKLVYQEYQAAMEVIKLSDIVCHGGRCLYSPQPEQALPRPAIVVFGLDRVSLSVYPPPRAYTDGCPASPRSNRVIISRQRWQKSPRVMRQSRNGCGLATDSTVPQTCT